MTKDEIIAEIRRIALLEGRKPLGQERFRNETGIKKSDWFPHFWSNWSEALQDAGFAPNKFSQAYQEDYFISKLIELTRALQRTPIEADMLRAKLNDPTFPSTAAFRRLGPKRFWAERVVSYCAKHGNNDDVSSHWQALLVPQTANADVELDIDASKVGYVYLMRHGSRREYKIGRTNNPIRREGEISLQLPEKLIPVHQIKTDDPIGVENYWHRRFASKRKEGEWFTLNAEDVRAFKRWKRIC